MGGGGGGEELTMLNVLKYEKIIQRKYSLTNY